MTPSERDREAARMIARYVPKQQGPAGRTEASPYDLVLYHATEALAAARLEEREACAKMVDEKAACLRSGSVGVSNGYRNLAAAIRARGSELPLGTKAGAQPLGALADEPAK